MFNLIAGVILLAVSLVCMGFIVYALIDFIDTKNKQEQAEKERKTLKAPSVPVVADTRVNARV